MKRHKDTFIDLEQFQHHMTVDSDLEDLEQFRAHDSGHSLA